MNPQQLQNYATKTVQQNTKAELQPYHQKAGEIEGQAAATGQRFAGYGEATNKLLQGIQQGSEGSAKTFQNQAAEQALKANQGIEQAGTQAQGTNAGYLDPQVAAQLNLAKGNVAGIGAARESSASTLGQSESNFMGNLRGAAAQRVLEGQGTISGRFGKELAANRGQENQLIGKEPGAITNLSQKLQQQQFADKAVEGKLASEGVKLKIAGAKLGLEGRKVSAQERDIAAKARGAKEGHELTGKKLGLEERKQSFGEWSKREDLNIKKLSAADKARYDEAQIRVKERGGKAASPKEGRSYMAKLSTAESIVKQIMGGVNQGRGNAQLQAQARAELAKKGASSDVISAALNLAVYGRLSTADQAAAISYGLTPNLRPQWFRKQ